MQQTLVAGGMPGSAADPVGDRPAREGDFACRDADLSPEMLRGVIARQAMQPYAAQQRVLDVPALGKEGRDDA